MEKLMAASGDALDRLFLEEMLPHHAGAITMAHQALPYREESELQAMARKIIADQAKEIGRLATMLEGYRAPRPPRGPCCLSAPALSAETSHRSRTALA